MLSPRDPFAELTTDPIWRAGLSHAGAQPPLEAELRCDLAIIGGGFTGLWSAIKARHRHPKARIVLLEAASLGNAASGRNGGFCAPSISHGVSNALARWPHEAERLVRMGRENLDDMERDLEALGIGCEFERDGKLNVAATPWQAAQLRSMQKAYASFGITTEFLEGDALTARLNSPKYTAGLFEPNYALLHPGKLVDGLVRVCRKHDVDIYEQSAVTQMRHRSGLVHLQTARGQVAAKRVLLATNAAQPLLRRLRPAILPVFDYTIVTEPLSAEQLRAIGWEGRYGVADSGNQFHYSRKTADNRILWGGYDAIYHAGSRRDPALLHRPESFARLQENFREVFPSLADVTLTHAWGGIIDTSARLTFFAGTALNGQLAYALGFTGQGVSATRFAALTMLDLLEGAETPRTSLRMLRRRPVPFPPEPLRNLAVRWAQRDLAREDQTGKRSLFLRLLDQLGIGFGS